ncbi:MAG: MATE family efflux transporter [Planctomycetota bacterium]|nr:MATE family efflux transporter [Planctomycetota bacterium]
MSSTPGQLKSDDGQIKSGRLVGKSLPVAIAILALPILIQQFLAATVGLVDKMLAGALPEEIVTQALDGLGVGSYVGWFIGIAMSGLGIGGQAIIARAMGAGDRLLGERALGQALCLSLGWGVLVSGVMWAGAPLLAQVAFSTDQVLAREFCIEYVRIIAVGLPCFGIMMVGGMCMHGAGESIRPSLIAVIVNIVNVCVSWVLSGADLRWGESVLENPFQYDLHVQGIAWGSSASFLVGAVLTLLVLGRGIRDLKLYPGRLKIEWGMAWRVIRIGIPNFIEGCSMWTANLVVLWFIGIVSLRGARDALEATGAATADLAEPGEGLQGAHIIAVQWESFSFMPGFAIGIAAGSIAGQYLGAGNVRMAKKAVWMCTGLGILIMGLCGIVLMVYGKALTAVVSDQAIHMEYVPKLLFICGATQVFFATSMVVRQALRGTGDTFWVFIITSGSSYLVRLPLAWFLGIYLGYGLVGIWIGLCSELAVRAVLFLSRFIHGGWARRTL